MAKKNGFTLIELLIVIAIIGILAAISIGIIGSSKHKAIFLRTTSSIEQLKSACLAYQKIFQDYPDLNRVPALANNTIYNAYSGGESSTNLGYTQDNMIEMNKRLVNFLEEQSYRENPNAPTWAQKVHPPLIEENLPKSTDQDDNNTAFYIDGWGNALLVWWGRDHTGDTPAGPDNYDENNATLRYRYAPDIYSMGEDGEDDITGTSTTTTTDFSEENLGEVDDIVSWQRTRTK